MLKFIYRFFGSASKKKLKKPTSEEIDEKWRTLSRDDFQVWYDQFWPLEITHYGIVNTSLDRIKNHPEHKAMIKFCKSLRDGDVFYTSHDKCVFNTGDNPRKSEDISIDEAIVQYQKGTNQYN